jgi:hypothetical protein
MVDVLCIQEVLNWLKTHKNGTKAKKIEEMNQIIL